ncbi:MAG: MATE family efflux transporter, partial [Negativicutes bacterium]|nr:MATE family efflux transporter [Negativicutes bacterium]
VCLAVRLAYFRSSRSRLKIAFTRPSRSVASQICRCGSAALTGQFATFAVYTAMTCLLLDLGGSDALAAGGVLERLFSLLVMPVVAISVGAQPIISYNYGSGDTGRLRRSLWSAVGLATAVSCLAMLICQLFPSSIMSLFFLRGNALTYGTDALLICTLSFPVIGLAIVGSEYFPAVYRPRVGVVLTLLRQIVFLLPLMYILSRYWQINGLWAALPLSDLLIVLITVPLLMSDLSRRSG